MPRTLEIDEDIAFQKKEWLFQRIGLGVVFLFVLAALLGFTGRGGALSHGEAGDRGGPLHVEYERFVRRGGTATVRIHLRASPGDVRFWIAAPYLERVRVESVAPVPELVMVEADRHIYSIRTGSPDITVMVEVEHQSAGMLDAEIGLVGGPSARFRQLSIY